MFAKESTCLLAFMQQPVLKGTVLGTLSVISVGFPENKPVCLYSGQLCSLTLFANRKPKQVSSTSCITASRLSCASKSDGSLILSFRFSSPFRYLPVFLLHCIWEERRLLAYFYRQMYQCKLERLVLSSVIAIPEVLGGEVLNINNGL